MFIKIQFCVCCIIFLFSSYNGQGQNYPKIYLNCYETCYEDYLKQELSFFDFVRDRYQCHLQILIKKQSSGNGGAMYGIYFLPKEDKDSHRADTLWVSTKASDTDDMIRKSILSSIKTGLLYFVRDTPHEQIFEVHIPKRKTTQLDSIRDKWNYWVLSAYVKGEAAGESNYTWQQFSGELNIRRITGRNKFLLTAWYESEFNEMILNQTLRNRVNKCSVFPLYVKSVSEHWSIGMLSKYDMDEFRNIRGGLKVAPVIEYNLFPYKDNVRKQFRFAYQAGGQYWKYIDTTVFFKKTELRPYHKLSVITEITQPWGSIISSLHGSNYLDKFSLYRLELDCLFSLRLIEGLALNIEIEASHIHDQISLLKSELSDEIYLLSGQQLPTTFHYYVGVGFSYTFGSIHNSIVNPRLGRIE